MANGIEKYRSDSGSEITLTADDVHRLVCPQATQTEVELFLRYCAAHRLDPIGAKDAYLVKYGDQPATMITGYQVFNRRAKGFPSYRGIKSGVVVRVGDEVRHKQGSAVYGGMGETLLGGWAEVYVDGWEAPVYNEVSLSDYTTGKSNWKTRPGVMIEKVAKANAWRTAYPDEFGGMYTSEEMQQAQAPAKEAPAQAAPAPAPVDLQPIRDRFADFRDLAFSEVPSGKPRSDAATADILNEVGRSSMSELTAADVSRAVAYMDEAIGSAMAETEPIEYMTPDEYLEATAR